MEFMDTIKCRKMSYQPRHEEQYNWEHITPAYEKSLKNEVSVEADTPGYSNWGNVSAVELLRKASSKVKIAMMMSYLR